MTDYDGFHNLNETNPAPRADEPAAPEARTAAPAEPTERPYERSAYADAGYIPAADAGAMPRSYHCAAQAEHKKEKTPRRGMHPAAIVALCLVCAILGGLACSLAPNWMVKTDTPAPSAAEQPGEVRSEPAAQSGDTQTVLNLSSGESAKTLTTNKVSTGEMSATDIYYNLALEQVVGVKTEITYTNFFGYTTKAAVSGSGFIISEDGYILTNYHVIEEADSRGLDIQILTHDGETYTAAVIGFDADHDVALLKIDATGLNAAILGDSDAMLVGEQVYAVGNPTGELEYSMTEGIVSAKDREIVTTDGNGKYNTVSTFQTTAAINGGNSGGPIYNSRGEVIGIVVAKRVSTEIEGLAFAIPINDATRIAQDLISDGYVRGKAYLGIRYGTVTASAAQYYGLVQGCIVAGVEEGSCAERAGLHESDIIVAIDGKEITTGDELVAAKKSYSAGDSAVLKVYREGKYLELTVVFDEMVPETAAAAGDAEETAPETPQGSAGADDLIRDFLGGVPFGR